MSRISAISSNATQTYNYGNIASGKRINSAKDDASGLTISEKLKKESNAATANMSNDKEAKSALNIADGAMSGITDYLQRIKELSLKASNGLMGQAEKQAIQDEINQNLDGINQIAKNTTYNTMSLLDGKNDNMKIASNPDGSGQSIQFGVSTVEALGLKDYNVTGDFDMSRVDKALDLISSKRSSVGASTNGIDAAYSYSSNASFELTGADSRLEDLDIPSAVSKKKQEEVLENYRLMLAKKQREEEENYWNRMF